jgi:hypothetical protein
MSVNPVAFAAACLRSGRATARPLKTTAQAKRFLKRVMVAFFNAHGAKIKVD